MLTPKDIRDHAAAPMTPFWEGQARQILNWAADVIEAAQAVVDERGLVSDRPAGNGPAEQR